MPPIKVHEKALAHLSRGLYRSPASALRELVSNAWDANATTVRINTNYPNFLQLSVEDNGDGFTKDDFRKLMGGGIGNSEKRAASHPLIHNRPMIGRLGIGMLGIAQLCGSFTVTSKPKIGEGFRARIRLYDLLKEKLDKGDSSVMKESQGTDDEPVVEVDVGKYDFEDFDRKAMRPGTRILADDVHPTFVRTFQESRRFEKFKEPPLEWSKALRILSKVHSLQESGDYWRLLWELAAACPIPYVSARALPHGLVRDEQKRLEVFDFTLLVDGIELRKPVYLSGNPYGYSTWPILTMSEAVYGKELRFHGYVLVQEGIQLRPDELRGIMIRIKDIGIGYYDPSLLDYRYNEGPRSRWITGEIFADAGLEDALNIDRDSFNRFHPHFRAIQKFVNDLLHEKVFPRSYKEIDKRSTARQKEKETSRRKLLKEVVASTVDSSVEVRSVAIPSEDPEAEPKVEIRKSGKGLRLNLPSAVKTKRMNRQLATSILAIFELAIRERDREKQRGMFTRLLLDLLNKW